MQLISNVYVEYAEKSKASNYDFVNSGILKNDNTRFFLIGTEEKFWIFQKNRLIEIYNEEKELKKINKHPKEGLNLNK